MEHIIAGRFQTRAGADAAIAVLVRHVARSDICMFHNDLRGHQAILAANGDADINAAPDVTEKSAPGPLPAADVIGIGVDPAITLAAGGVVLAVRISRQTSKELVVCDLRNCGAEAIEQAECEWGDGRGVEFTRAQTPRKFAA